MNRPVFAALSATFALFVFVPGAGAAVTLGSALAETANDGIACASTCTVVQSALPTGAVAAPFDGVVVRWRIRTDGPGGPFQLRVAKPFTGDSRGGSGSSAPQSTAAVGISEFPTRMPIRTGDNIGLDFSSANTAKFKHGVGVPGAVSLYFVPLLPDGLETAPDTVNTNTEMMYNADIEPDVDGDGFGDETQDACPAIAGPADGCDRVSPKITKKIAARQRVAKLTAYVTSDEPGQATARAIVKYKSGGRTRTITGKLAKTTLVAATRAKLTLKFSSKQLKTLRSLIAAGKKPRAKVSISVADPAGNKARASAYVKLKR